jgi:ABC-type sugar transport system ATPase subunit
MTTITVEHVSKSFKLLNGQQIQAVDDVSFKLSEGGSIAIIGPSGCGKTTLLRMIAGLDMPDLGRVLYNDDPISYLPVGERGIGMVFQNYALMPQWDAEHNIGFFLRLRKREQEITERVQMVSKITGVGIDHLLDKFPRELSGGEKQRVAIARAFARDLQLLLFDEPFANLDAKFRQESRIEARRLLSNFPVTSIYVTHDQQEASMMSDRILVMREGCIEQVGSYQSLYDAPKNIFIAQFIGVPTINLFEGIVQDRRWYGECFGELHLPMLLPDDTTVTIGIRAQHIHLGGNLSARINKVTPYFAERFTLLDVSQGNEHWQIQTPLDRNFSNGEMITCEFDLTQARFFDTKTGKRIS